MRVYPNKSPRGPSRASSRCSRSSSNAVKTSVVQPKDVWAGLPREARSHLCFAIMLCFVRGWNAQWEVWRLIGSERLGGFAPVNVSDQAIDHHTLASSNAAAMARGNT